MGQFDSQSLGLPPIGKIGLSDSDRGIGLPKRKKSMYVETKKKAKPKTAAAGSPPPPPPKGPKNPKNNDKENKEPKNNDKENKKSKSLGGLTKGMSSKNNQKMSPKETMDNIRGKK